MSSSLLLAVPIVLILILAVRRVLAVRSIKQYRASDVENIVQSRNDHLLLDVRTAAERKGSTISGSIHIPLQSLRSRLEELRKHQGKEIVCYCQTGNRSVSAALLLRRNGFRVANLEGGIAEWNFLRR